MNAKKLRDIERLKNKMQAKLDEAGELLKLLEFEDVSTKVVRVYGPDRQFSIECKLKI